MIREVCLLVFLGICSVEDIWKKKIHVSLLILFICIGVIFAIVQREESLWSLLGGALIGAMLYAISVLSQERIGKGDGIMLMMTGVFLGFWENLTILWLASVLAAAMGVLWLVVFHKEKNARLPFAPFLLTAFVIFRVITLCG